jgi:DNA repair protein RecO (recombination protein O)
MNQLLTRGIVLSRTDYGEADRIITMLTPDPDHGKLRLMARGVRKPKSKLAGGIELFSVSDLSFIRGRGEIGTLVSARLITHYGHIVQDITRVQLGYELIKMLNKATEDQPEPDYFELLEQAFMALDDAALDPTLIRLWFSAQLLRQAGHSPNLQTTLEGDKLLPDHTYNFDYDAVSFTPHAEGQRNESVTSHAVVPSRESEALRQTDTGREFDTSHGTTTIGHFTANDIKFLRLAFSGNQPQVLNKIADHETLVAQALPLVQTMLQTYIRL